MHIVIRFVKKCYMRQQKAWVFCTLVNMCQAAKVDLPQKEKHLVSVSISDKFRTAGTAAPIQVNTGLV